MPTAQPAVEFDGFHRVELPARLAATDDGAAAAGQLGPGRSLSFRLPDGRAFTYRTHAQRVTVEPGDDAPLVVEVDADAFADLVTERWSIFGLLYPGRLRVAAGGFDEFAMWEPALQSLWFHRPLYDDAAASSLRDRDGQPLDVRRSFRFAAADDAEVAHFLRTAGFVVLREVFAPAEIALLDAEVQRLRATATPADNRSWWATDAAGREVCCRLTYCSERSAHIGALHEDERLRRIASWHGAPLRPSPDRLDGYSVVIKNPEVVQGLSDLPWHRDCGMGGHAVLCPSLSIGIQIDAASAANGQLVFLAGSHEHANLPTDVDAHPNWPVVAVETQPGDVTVHYAHVMHGAPPPTSPSAGRRVLYVGFKSPAVFDMIPPGKGYNDVVFSQGDGRVRSVDELV
ncbi:MAG TPA: phytanoyl-CoA dioxygenase family protein [Acidimicrobiales bacterium]|jgi:ectoine hydroxylase-related dioxygenase (phytanoyl-CoA dioxygenase family)|nr:phytanoyl-CoA dioxygenase family protein [Acidimicrobiales bacterium]